MFFQEKKQMIRKLRIIIIIICNLYLLIWWLLFLAYIDTPLSIVFWWISPCVFTVIDILILIYSLIYDRFIEKILFIFLCSFWIIHWIYSGYNFFTQLLMY
jgi:hypothetical protein